MTVCRCHPLGWFDTAERWILEDEIQDARYELLARYYVTHRVKDWLMWTAREFIVNNKVSVGMQSEVQSL